MADTTSRVAVVGASGFVGSAVSRHLEEIGVAVIPVASPRLRGTIGGCEPTAEEVDQIAARFQQVDCVINAAGISDALSGQGAALDGANGLLPGLLARACGVAGARLIHISSAAVQGSLPLDSSERYAPFSAYSRSKVIGELAALAPAAEVCVFRPPGVHAPTRSVTQSLAKIARTPLSSVAAPGTANTPQAQLSNVADAVAFLALYKGKLPRIVHMPSEGIATAELLEFLGGRRPVRVPRWLARAVVSTARLLGDTSGRFGGHARRLELMWFGQEQAPSWLTEVGWTPPVSKNGWHQMAPVTDQEDDR